MTQFEVISIHNMDNTADKNTPLSVSITKPEVLEQVLDYGFFESTGI